MRRIARLCRSALPGRWPSWLLMAFGLFLFVPGLVRAQASSDSTGRPSGSVLVLPNVFYTPETKIAGGLVLGYYRPLDMGSPTSSIQLAAIYTQRRQYYLQFMPEAYWSHGRWWVTSEVWLSQYPNAFNGIGPAASADQEEEYTARIADVQGSIQRRVRAGWHAGLRVRVRAEDITEVAADGLLDTQPIPGRTGATTVGAGVVTTWDQRDNLYFPRQGYYMEARAVLHRADASQQHTFARFTVDARRYWPVATNHVLALNGYAEAVAGTAPFQLLPLLGGADRMRGYREGRYRDNVLALVQGAYRFPLVWRFKGAVFANAGNVAPRIGQFGQSTMKYAVGGGLRLRLNEEGVHGRVDYAIGPDGGALYITLLEAF